MLMIQHSYYKRPFNLRWNFALFIRYAMPVNFRLELQDTVFPLKTVSNYFVLLYIASNPLEAFDGKDPCIIVVNFHGV